MPRIKFSELPGHLRVKLTEEGKKELWHRVDEFGGIKALSKSFEFSQSKMYNWKNKDLALPVKFVRRIMGENSIEEIIVLKGKGSSGRVRSPNFPLKASDELLTRVEESVVRNDDGTPFYLVKDEGLASRFVDLLNQLGEVDWKIYLCNSRFEVRFPKFLDQIFSDLDFESSFAVVFDENGYFEDDRMVTENQSRQINNFEGRLYSTEKAYKLAVKKVDSGRIREIISRESSKVEKLL